MNSRKVCLAVSMGALFLLGAGPAYAIAISNVRITDVSPNPIPCGSTATVTVQFDYFVPAHGNTLPQTGTVQIRESDPFWEADETLAQGTVTIGVGDPQQGTKTVKLYVTCGPPDEDCHCPFGGGHGLDDEESPHEIYASVVKEWESDPSSPSVKVNCQKEDGTMACADSSLTPGGTAVASVNYIQTTGVAHMNLEIGYDPTLAVVTNAWFDPAVAGLFASTAVDITVPGSVRFLADNPTDVLVDPFPMFVEFYTPPGTPFGSSPLGVAEASELFDQDWQPLIVQHGSGHLVIVPPDSAAPVIDAGLIVADVGNDMLLGGPGAVSDDYLGVLPRYVQVATAIMLPDGTPGFLGAVADVAPDGSFVLAEAGLNPCEPLVLFALDDAENRSSADLPFLEPVPAVSHVPQDPIVAPQDVIPLMFPIAVAIPAPADGSVIVTSTNPAVAVVLDETIEFSAAGPLCGETTIWVNGVGMAELMLATDMGFPVGPPRIVEVLPTGACCLGLVCTENVTEAACLAMGGFYQGDGTVCDPNPCDTIPPGQDCWTTQCGATQANFAETPIPAGFFDPGSDPFDGDVRLGGSPLEPSDTIVQRLDTLDLPYPLPVTDVVPIEIVALSLVSCEPILVGGSGLWNVSVGLSSTPAPLGMLSATRTYDSGGTFSATFFVQPVYTFTRVDPPHDVRVLDTGAVGWPPFAMQTLDPGPWYDVDSFFDVCLPDGFSPGHNGTCCVEVCHSSGGMAPQVHCMRLAGCPPCPERGACCIGIECADGMTQADCEMLPGAVYLGDGSVCDPVPTACYGDADCSRRVDFDDINYFVAALASGESGWWSYYRAMNAGNPPPCTFWNCDANGSGRCNDPQSPEVDFDDINPFVAKLVAPPACP